jgi:hypothetical protein
MSHSWPSETAFRRIDLNVQDRVCTVCKGSLHVCAHRHRRLFTLQGPWLLVVRLVHCLESDCPGHRRTISPAEEMAIALPRLTVGWDVFAWIGHRRFSRHWSVPQICGELSDSHRIGLSEDAVEKYLRRYQAMVAARHTDSELLRAAYAGTKSVILAIDGLQPEKGHETLYVIRELNQKRVWFAEPLLSSATDEVRRLLVRARQMAEALGLPVGGWMSDKQDAFLQGIAAEFPGVPHAYCQNHFLRDLAKPVLEQDSHAKVQMRSKIRGLRAIEQEVLREQAEVSEGEAERPENVGEPSDAGQVVLEYCAAVRGILNDDQGGPLHPPGLRMAEALQEVRQSLQRNLEAEKGGWPRARCGVWRDASSVGWARSKTSSKTCGPK